MADEAASPETTAADRPGRDDAGRFVAGNPGRPKGARHAALLALDAIGEQSAASVLQKVAAMALEGDMRAADLLLRRLWPERKGRPVALALPALDTAADLPRALGAIADAVADGLLTPDEAQSVAAVLETQRRAIETAELAARIEALETRAEIARR